nr:hypothetical protein [Candidatus Eremiobacteraeota bacterium]
IPAVIVLFCAAIAAGCGSATDNLDFKAPAAWKATPSILGMMQGWTNPSDSNQIVMLMKLPIGKDINVADANTQLRNTKITANKSIKICGNQPAQFVTMTGTSGSSKTSGNPKSDRKSVAEMITTRYSNSSYMAIYDREMGTPADPQAETALKSLCLKKAS